MTESSCLGVVMDVEEENSMTLDDFIEEEQQLQSDANAVLGSSDDKNCTYNLGYVQRQALYVCMTCTPQIDSSSKPAGICLACSYHCHEGHDLIELYTKRYFRCDCGNKRFQGKTCNLEPNKSDENERNTYNHNFKGLYCTCLRPYPDPDDDVEDSMLQCIICEDWFHTRHLGQELPPDSNYAEMICGSCTDRLTFLKFYLGYSITSTSKNESVESNSLETSLENATGENNVINGLKVTVENEDKKDTEEKKEVEEKLAINIAKVEGETLITNGPLDTSIPTGDSEEPCLLDKMKELDRIPGSATFWPSNFRLLLCSCSKCKALYSVMKVPWILDESDTVQAYEEKGLQTAETVEKTQYEAGMKELAKLNRFQQVEVIQNYNEFKNNLCDFLNKFVKEKKVVRKEDIDEFFDDMQAKKRQKLGTPPYTCH